MKGQSELENLYDSTTASTLDEFTRREPPARRPVFVTPGSFAGTIAEIAEMRTRASHQKPAAPNVVGVSERISRPGSLPAGRDQSGERSS